MSEHIARDTGQPLNQTFLMRIKGFALIIVLIVSVLLALFISVVLFSSKRQSDLSMDHNQRLKFSSLNQRIRNIFEAVDLCTCNLRDFVRPSGQDILIQGSVSAPLREEFGYYQLTSNRSSAATLCGPLNAADVVLHTDGSFPESTKASQVRITQFTSKGSQNGLDRYSAKFIFAIEAGQTKARSNQSDPIALDLFLEMAGDRIVRCYAPYVVAGPVSSSPPSCGRNTGDNVPPNEFSACCGGKVDFLPVGVMPDCNNSISDCCELVLTDSTNRTCTCPAWRQNLVGGSCFASACP